MPHFNEKNNFHWSLALEKSAATQNEAVAKTAPYSPHVQPGPYLCHRHPRGAEAQAWAAGLLFHGTPSPAKQEEHIASPELPCTLGCCFTSLKIKINFHTKQMCQLEVQVPTPAVLVIRGRLMRCRVLQSSKKELHYALNCIFHTKHTCGPYVRGLRRWSCSPAFVLLWCGRGEKIASPEGVVFWHGAACRELLYHTGLIWPPWGQVRVRHRSPWICSAWDLQAPVPFLIDTSSPHPHPCKYGRSNCFSSVLTLLILE